MTLAERETVAGSRNPFVSVPLPRPVAGHGSRVYDLDDGFGGIVPGVAGVLGDRTPFGVQSRDARPAGFTVRRSGRGWRHPAQIDLDGYPADVCTQVVTVVRTGAGAVGQRDEAGFVVRTLDEVVVAEPPDGHRLRPSAPRGVVKGVHLRVHDQRCWPRRDGVRSLRHGLGFGVAGVVSGGRPDVSVSVLSTVWRDGSRLLRIGHR